MPLTTLYASIRSRAPQAKVTVVGYPRIFNGVDCNLLTWFSSTEMSRLNATADLLNSTTAARASAAGFAFANPTTAFVGHAVCSSTEWINGLSNPVVESYHPNKSGHASGYTPTVSPYVTGSTVTVTAAVLTTAKASEQRLADQQRTYAAADRLIRPRGRARPRPHDARGAGRGGEGRCRPLRPGQHRRGRPALVGPPGGGARAPLTGHDDAATRLASLARR